MNTQRSPLVYIVLAICLLAGVFYYFETSKTRRYDWSESSWNKKAYTETSDQPYGTQTFHRFLEDYFPNSTSTDLKEDVSKELPAEGSGHDNYVFVGEGMYLDSLGTDRLLNFVKNGNTALISSKTIPFDLMTFVYYHECEEAIWADYSRELDTFAHLSLRTPLLRDTQNAIFYSRQNKAEPYTWHHIPEQFFCDSLGHHPLGYQNDEYINFAVFPYGKGRFLLHCTPLAFSNYSLTKPPARAYADGVLSHLQEGNIYWDAVSRVPESVARSRNGSQDSGGGNRPDEHLLAYMLKQPSLAWAWYLLVGSALLWVIFRAKRRRRIIPIIPPKENTSYEFISTIAHLQFKQQNYQALCMQNMRLFCAQTRERHNIPIGLDPESGQIRISEDNIKQLAQVSEVPEAHIREILRQYATIIQYQPTEQMAIDLHQALSKFESKK